ncbi:hypothetical protein [Kribbia dieselivorans]|uniref:hypothetical protein n=1 Tax=Kribbia dieselivorans TaxID=331526 RepID=UPI000838812D|nr:hypothetical protein [Kribbia dieselivorans]
MLRARVEMLIALVVGAAAVATYIWPTWIESLTPFEPDGGSGESEWWLVMVLAVVAIIALLLSARDFRVQRRLRRLDTALETRRTDS